MLRTFLSLPIVQCAVLCAALAAAGVAGAQERDEVPRPPQAPLPAPSMPMPQENVRLEFARVLAAEPVIQTLRSTSMVEHCDPVSPLGNDTERRGLSRVVGAVRDVLTPGEGDEDVEPPAAGECRMVPVEREFRRPIGYDVDYVHRGITYRSRMPYDPGNRVQVRMSVTPVVNVGD